MALILMLETATTMCSVTLAENGNVIALKEQNERNIHAGSITLFIEEVMQNADKRYADLEAIAVSMGPGSYTGLRIGVSTAKGLCYALDISLIAVNTLEAMVYGLLQKADFKKDDMLFCPMIDARRMEVYMALFDGDMKIIERVQAKIVEENSFDNYLADNQIVFFGDGAEKCRALYAGNKNALFVDFENSAAHLSAPAFSKFQKNETVDVAYFEPFYLKDFVAAKPKANN